MHQSRFGIVGSGFAGATCANELLDAGVKGREIRFYEKNNHQGRGGRAAPRAHSNPDASMTCQGATFISGKELQEQFSQLGCEPVELNRFFFQDGDAFREDSGQGPLSVRRSVIKELEECGRNLSIKQALKSSGTFKALSNEHKKMLLEFWTNEFGAEPHEVGVRSLLASDTVSDADEFLGVCRSGGFHVFADNLLSRACDNGAAIEWNRTLVAIEPNTRDGISLEFVKQAPIWDMQRQKYCHGGDYETTAHQSALITVPVDVLRKISVKNKGEIIGSLVDHIPSLAQKRIKSLQLASIVKITVNISRLVIPETPTGYILLRPDKEERSLGCNEVWMLPPPPEMPQAKQTLLLYMGGDKARSLFGNKGGKQGLTSRVREYCRDRLGLSQNDILGEVEVSAWIQSQERSTASRGAYAYIAADGDLLENHEDFDFRREVLPGLYLAGEGLAKDYVGFVRGAIQTGKDAAEGMLTKSHTSFERSGKFLRPAKANR